MVTKTTDSALTGTNLRLILHNLGIKTVVCCGIFTDQCISSTVRSLAGFVKSMTQSFAETFAKWRMLPRPDQALGKALKGLDQRYRLYNYLAIMVGAAPPAEQREQADAKAHAARLGSLHGQRARENWQGRDQLGARSRSTWRGRDSANEH